MAEQQEPTQPQADPETITVYDEKGQQVRIPRKQWAEEILPEGLKATWDQPEQLYAQVMANLRMGFAPQVLDAARRLVEIDPSAERAAVTLAIALTQTNQGDEAESVLRDYIAKHGETGAVLTNLSKVQNDRGETEHAEATLRKALSLDPNLDQALAWWAGLARARGGDDAMIAALEEVAAEKGAWRPQMILARERLKRKEIDTAVALYRDIMPAAKDYPDALMQISGDLGNAGRLEDLVTMIGPIYDPVRHGAYPGMNLLQALAATGRIGPAQVLLGRLEAMKDPSVAQALAELSKRLKAAAPAPVSQTQPGPQTPGQVQVVAVPLGQPVWAAGFAEPSWMFPPMRENATKVVLFSLADGTRSAGKAQAEAENDVGRLTRSLPMYLAEALRLRTDALSACIIPVIANGGPVVSSTPWPLPQMLEACPPEFQPDILVCGALTRGARGSKVELHLFRAKDRAPLRTIRVPANEDFTGTALKAEQELTAALVSAGVTPLADAGAFRAPAPEAADTYLLCVGQLLSQVLVAGGMTRAQDLWNERGMLENYFRLVGQSPGAVSPVLMAATGVLCSLKYGSPHGQEFRGQLLDLLKSGAESSEIVRRAVPAAYRALQENEAYTAAKESAAIGAEGEYAEWLAAIEQ